MRAFSSRTHPIAFSCIRTPCIHICILNSLHSVRGPFNCNSTAFLLCCIRYKLHLSQCTFLYIQLHYIKLHSVAFCLCTTYNVIQHTFILAAFTYSTFTYIHVHLLKATFVAFTSAYHILMHSVAWQISAFGQSSFISNGHAFSGAHSHHNSWVSAAPGWCTSGLSNVHECIMNVNEYTSIHQGWRQMHHSNPHCHLQSCPPRRQMSHHGCTHFCF